MAPLTALTRAPAATLPDCELTYLDRTPIDLALARRQHVTYCAALHQAGARVVTLPADDRFPDSVFVEDTAIILDEIAVLTRPGAASRQGEVDLIAPAIAVYRPTVRLQPPATLEGGDVMRVGRTLFVSPSRRSNVAGIAALRSVVTPYGYTVVSVSLRDCLHLKTACTALDAETVLLYPAWVDAAPFAGYRLIPVAPDEPLAANTLRVHDTVLMSAAFPRTQDIVRGLGYSVVAVDT
ncbi:MAG: dimethylargininase, partial [Anaerolineae bacterium]|nr:dimethylargininase [Anaerolineae bacterium]